VRKVASHDKNLPARSGLRCLSSPHESHYSYGVPGRLAEVAERAAVGEATVSRVLNGRPGASSATRTAVVVALDVLGDERPGKLRGERARRIGLVVPETDNPVFPAFAHAIGGALARLGFTTVLCAAMTAARPRRTTCGCSCSGTFPVWRSRVADVRRPTGGSAPKAFADQGRCGVRLEMT
jgi:hypothetical protein